MKNKSFKQLNGLEKKVTKKFDKEDIPIDDLYDRFKLHKNYMSTLYSDYTFVAKGHNVLLSYCIDLHVLFDDIKDGLMNNKYEAVEAFNGKHTFDSPEIDMGKWISFTRTHTLDDCYRVSEFYANMLQTKHDALKKKIEDEIPVIKELVKDVEKCYHEEYRVIEFKINKRYNSIKSLSEDLERVDKGLRDMYRKTLNKHIMVEELYAVKETRGTLPDA